MSILYNKEQTLSIERQWTISADFFRHKGSEKSQHDLPPLKRKEWSMRTIVFAGGGTAGHIMPNIALINELKSTFNCVYIGGDGMEKDLCKSRAIPFFRIDTVKLRRDAMLKNIAVPIKLYGCIKSAKRALDQIKPCLIFGKGGYAALPVVLAAHDIPVISHESDLTPGLTTRIAKRKSKYVACAFEPCARLFKNGIYTGTPLAQNLYRGTADKSFYGFTGNKPVLAIIGGSSGASAINDCVVAAIDILTETFDVIHMTGKNKRGASVRRGYCPIEFENNMPRLYATSDIVITRAGANALCECIALGKPTLAIPLEKASRGDQLQNAEYFKNKNAIEVLREKDMTAQSFSDAAIALLKNKSHYSAAQKSLSVDGTKKICEIIKQTAYNGCLELSE